MTWSLQGGVEGRDLVNLLDSATFQLQIKSLDTWWIYSFPKKNREKVIAGIAKLSSWKISYGHEMLEEGKKNFRVLLQMLAVIGRVTSSRQLIKVFAFRKYCLNCNLCILEKWSWWQVFESVHCLLAHTWEMIVLNKNYGLMAESEQGSEHQTMGSEVLTGDHGAASA
jgi:hypothetical protein